MQKLDLSKGWNNHNNGYDIISPEVKKYINTVPSPLQKSFSDLEYYSFIHFGMNTFTGREWGKGNEDESLFCPKNIDTDQWVRVLKKSGSKGVIFTAKHHDGFCLFDTNQTTHNVMNSPYKKDIVKMLSQSCKKYDMKLGIYLSPWDRHEETYGKEAYNDFFASQLKELCTNYGEIFCFWFDGAKGKDAPDFEYDFQRYYDIIHELQPNSVISNCGEDVRWIGNEAGKVRKSEWNVVPRNCFDIEKTMKNSQQSENNTTSLQHINKMDEDLGSREKLRQYSEYMWYPGEADVSIHKGWFYNKKPKRRSLRELIRIYYNTVGGNALLLLNVPVSKNGIIEKKDEETLTKFGNIIYERFEKRVNYTISYPDRKSSELEKIPLGEGNEPMDRNQNKICCNFGKKEKIRTIVLKEDIFHSQRIEEFYILYKKDDKVKIFDRFSVIGSKKIIRIKGTLNTDEIMIFVTQSRSNPYFRSIEFYK